MLGEAPDLIRSTCRCKLSLSKSQSCLGSLCEQKMNTSEDFITSNTRISSPSVSLCDTASIHSSSDESSCQSVNVTSFPEDSMVLHRTPPRVSSINTQSSCSSKRSPSVSAYDSPIMVSPTKCEHDAVMKETPFDRENATIKSSLARLMFKANLMKAVLCILLILLFLLVMHAADHSDQIHSIENYPEECIFVQMCRKIKEFSLNDFKQMYLKPLEEVVHTAYHTVLDQTVCLLNNTMIVLTEILETVFDFPLDVAYLYTISAFAGCLLFYAIVRVSKSKQRVEYHRESVAGFVEKILTILVAHQQSFHPPANPYLSVGYVQELLIAPHDRKRLKGVWEAAVRAIEERESAGHVKIKATAPSGTKVWRFIPSTQPETQRPAPQHSFLPIPIGSSPCIRLQYLFDITSFWGEGWVEILRLSIAEKRIELLHFWPCQISRDEGMVYMKCATREESGKLRRCLEMWFFGQNYEITYTDDVRFRRMMFIAGKE